MSYRKLKNWIKIISIILANGKKTNQPNVTYLILLELITIVDKPCLIYPPEKCKEIYQKGPEKFGFNNFQNWWANMLWVKMFRGQQKFGKTILGVENLGVHIFGVLQMERSACTMGKRGPPLAYVIF